MKYNYFLAILFVVANFSLNAQKWSRFTFENSKLPSYTPINSIIVDINNVKWVGTEKGLVKIENDTIMQVYDTLNSLIGNNFISTLAIDNNELLWIGTSNSLVTFDGQTFTKITDTYFKDRVMGIDFDSQNNIWVNLEYNYLCSFKNNIWKKITHLTQELPLAFLRDFVIDNDDVLWLLFPGHSIYSGDTISTLWTLKDDVFEQYIDPYRIKEQYYANDLLIDKNNVKWIGHSYGLSRFDGVNWSHFDAKNNSSVYPCYTINKITEDTNSTIWCGMACPSEYSNLLQFSNGNWVNHDYTSSNLIYKQESDTYSIASDKNNNIILGVWGALYQITNEMNLGINEFTKEQSICFPNPNNGSFTLNLNLIGNYILTNQLGQTLKTFEVKNPGCSMFITDVSPGIYFLNMLETNNKLKILITE